MKWAAAFFALAIGSAQDTAMRAGAKIFARDCQACHGSHARGTRHAPPLVSPHITTATPDAIAGVIRNGRLWRGMPSFAHLPEPQRRQLVAYLKSLNK